MAVIGQPGCHHSLQNESLATWNSDFSSHHHNGPGRLNAIERLLKLPRDKCGRCVPHHWGLQHFPKLALGNLLTQIFIGDGEDHIVFLPRLYGSMGHYILLVFGYSGRSKLINQLQFTLYWYPLTQKYWGVIGMDLPLTVEVSYENNKPLIFGQKRILLQLPRAIRFQRAFVIANLVVGIGTA